MRPVRIECRAANLDDAPGVAWLMEPLFPREARSEALPAAERLLSETLRAGGEYHVVRYGGRIVAGCQVGPLLKSAGFDGCWALGLWVHPTMRGRGTGEALVRHVIRAARDRGERTFYCHIASSNTASLRLFRKLGFGEADAGLRARVTERFGSAFGEGGGVHVLSLDLTSLSPRFER